MSGIVLFRDRQDFQANDWREAQGGISTHLRYLASDGFGDGRYYVGLNVTKNSNTSIRIEPGRLWNQGRVFAREEDEFIGAAAEIVDLAGLLPITNTRLVALVAWGREIETNDQQRHFIVDITTRQTERQSVPMYRVREAVVDVLAGVESTSPQLPAIAAANLHFCTVTLSPSGITAIEMHTDRKLLSNRDTWEWIREFLLWKLRVEAQVEALRSEILALRDSIGDMAPFNDVRSLAFDVGNLVEAVRVPRIGAVGYSADHFRDEDYTDDAQPGYDARLEFGLLFPTEAAATMALELLSPADSGVINNGGLVLPAYQSVQRFSLFSGGTSGDTGFAVESVTLEQQKLEITTWHNVTGQSYNQYMDWFVQKYPWGPIDLQNPQQPGSGFFWASQESYPYIWNKTWTLNWELRPLDIYVSTGTLTTITGAMLAQVVMMPASMWLTEIGVHFSQVGPTGDVQAHLLNVTEGGKPDLSTILVSATVAHADLRTGNVRFKFPTPIFAEGGKRYAVLLSTDGNHRVATTTQKYSEGDMFSIASGGSVINGDISKDLAIAFYGAQFDRVRTTTSLKPAALSGGIRDMIASLVKLIPQGTELELQYQVNGNWLTFGDTVNTNTLPSLLPLRFVFLGTSDVQPAVNLPLSTLKVSRPKAGFTHYSIPRSLPSGSDTISVQAMSHRFDPAAHTLTAELIVGGSTVVATTTEIRQWPDGTTQHIFDFDLGAPISSYRIKLTGTRNSADTHPFTVHSRQDVAR